MRFFIRPQIFTVLFYVLLSIYIGVILNMRLFPSQDGPLHLYYADVLAALWRGTAAYDGFFAIRHLVSPYALHNYILIALNLLFYPITSEKILVCLYLLIFCFGFRYLVFSVSKEAGAASLLAFPFSLYKLVYLGFYNFILGTAIALWVCGFWMRYNDRLSGWRSFVFLLLIVILLMTHPVSLLLSLLFFGIQLIVSTVLRTREFDGRWLDRFAHSTRLHKMQMINIAIAGCSLIYIRMFISPDKKMDMPIIDVHHIAQAVFDLIQLIPLSPFNTLTYRIVLGSVPIMAGLLILLALWHRKGGFRVEYGDELLVFSGLCAIAYLVTPFSIYDYYFFNERFPIFSIIFFLAYTATVRLPAPRQLLIGVAIFGVSCLLLYAQVRHTESFINNATVLEQAPAMKGDTKGVILFEKLPIVRGLNFNPTRHVSAHYFRRSGAVLLNGAWLNNPIMMLTSKGQALDLGPGPMTEFLASDINRAGLPAIGLIIVPNRENDQAPPIRTLDIANHYGLSRMPCSSQAFTFYARPEMVSVSDWVAQKPDEQR